MFRIAIAFLLALMLCCQATAGEKGYVAAQMAYIAVCADLTAPDMVIPAEPNTPAPDQKTVSYEEARKLYAKERKPIVVMITADWCPYCKPVKEKLLAMQKDGQLDEASLVIIDWDKENADARAAIKPLLRRPGLPFLKVYYTRNGRSQAAKPDGPEDVPAILKESNRLSAPPAVSVQPVSVGYVGGCANGQCGRR